MRQLLTVLLVVLSTASIANAEFYTTRVLNRSGRAYSSNELEFTPNGEKLLLSFGKGTIATVEIKTDGLRAVSPDGKYFGAVGRRRETASGSPTTSTAY